MTNGTITVRNSYNPDGARIAKIVNRSNGSETHRYTYNGGKLVYDIIRINKEGTISNLTILMSYDESGRPFMITYANVSYYYLLNAQGDVVGIMNVSGDIMVEYTYDAWGNVLSITGPMASTMGQHNQLRYRGYVYDPETGLYFLNSRFYDPEKGRFINADAYASTGQGFFGYNMFSYCLNNPLVLEDSDGAAARVCITADCRIDEAPWRDYSPGGGGRYEEYHYQPNKYGNVADKFYTVRFFRAVANGVETGAEWLWEAYMRGYNIQQTAQMQEAQMMLDAAIKIYDIEKETEIIGTGMSVNHAVKAGQAAKKAWGYFVAPIPTLADEYFAAGYALKAIYHLWMSIGG